MAVGLGELVEEGPVVLPAAPRPRPRPLLEAMPVVALPTTVAEATTLLLSPAPARAAALPTVATAGPLASDPWQMPTVLMHNGAP